MVGAGLAGLSAAAFLAREEFDVHVVEAADAVGGRIRTDEVDGFLLDRGFQVLLTAYDEVQQQVDLDSLSLRPFRPGSLVWKSNGMQRLSDPLRDPAGALAAAAAQVGTMRDKLKVASLRQSLLRRTPEECFEGPVRSTLEELNSLGFTRDFIDSFFRPFLGGVFLERELETDARLFRYYFRCFADGDAALPARGMQHLPELLAEPVHDRISLGRAVTGIEPGRASLEGGDSISADVIILAVDGSAAARLASVPAPDFKEKSPPTSPPPTLRPTNRCSCWTVREKGRRITSPCSATSHRSTPLPALT